MWGRAKRRPVSPGSLVVDLDAVSNFAVRVDGITVALFASRVHAEFFGHAWKNSHPKSTVTITPLEDY